MLNFKWCEFSELTSKQLYDILALRASVFVVEQHCPYLDPDGRDFFSMHLLGLEENSLVAYLRLFLPTEMKTISHLAVLLQLNQRGPKDMEEN
ncbi:hypothetical protein PGH43_02020 [Legionella pneumophila 130b]|nr:hypothetical protein PGH43_02020 [Legionella pneumophila 130b]